MDTTVLDELKPAVYSLVIIISALWFVYAITTYILRNRREQVIEEAKEVRAEKYTAAQREQAKALDALAASTQQLVEMHHEHGRRIQDTFASLHISMDKVNTSLRELTEFHTRVMTLDDSLRLVDHYFRELIRDTQDLLCRVITEGTYLARREFIARKVRTELSDVYSRLYSRLLDYNLCFGPEEFFKTYEGTAEDTNTSYERFVLVDLVWSATEPILMNETGATDDRKEEIKLIVVNTVSDYLSGIGKKIRESRRNQTDKLIRQEAS